MKRIFKYLNSSIGKKQLVAISGLALVMFLLVHLLGNFTMYVGPEAINEYSKKLHSLGPLLWVARLGLIGVFFLHFGLVGLLVYENIKARKHRYHKPLHKKTRSLFTKTMRISGVIVFAYVGVHLVDYTFTPHTEALSTVRGEYLGLYGHVYNSFLNPLRALFYIIAMFSIGFHLIHGVQSVLQTFGFNHETYTPIIMKTSWVVALLIAIGFSSIPIYVNLHNYFNWSIAGVG